MYTMPWKTCVHIVEDMCTFPWNTRHMHGRQVWNMSSLPAQHSVRCSLSREGYSDLSQVNVPQAALSRIVGEGGLTGPLKMVKSLKLRQMYLGTSAPTFHGFQCRPSPKGDYLQVETGLSFQSSGMQIIVRL